MGDTSQPQVDANVTGLSVFDVSLNAVNLGWDEVRLPASVFEGDTLYAQSEVVEARPSRSRPEMGIVRLRTTGFNQDGVDSLQASDAPERILGSHFARSAQNGFFLTAPLMASRLAAASEHL